MRFHADLHVHSKYSRATSRDCDLEHLSLFAQRKGLSVVATGDFTHPAWMEELKEKLVPAESGLLRLRPEIERDVERRVPASCRRPVRFIASVEISTIYKRDGATRKIHHLIYAPDLDTADRLRLRLSKIGNLSSDGRPILGLDSRDLLEMALESGPGTFLVPAHIWTPWFAVLGSKSGFDSVDQCYADLAPHIFAAETGLSSDPEMNWRVSALDRLRLVSNSDAHSPAMLGREACTFDCALDYPAMRRALETGEGYAGTLELFPEEGKYHLDGHRACQVRFEPSQTRQHGGRCPTCGQPLTVGVMHRVEVLADRAAGERPATASPFSHLVPLSELVAEMKQVGAKSRSVASDLDALIAQLGPELSILCELPLEAIRRAGSALLGEAVDRVRRGAVRREGGYDGEYGTIRVFDPEEIARERVSGSLFHFEELAPPTSSPAPQASKKSVAGLDLKEMADASDRPAVPPVVQSVPPDGLVDSPFLRALDPEQREAARALQGPLLIVAGPGTGKTRTLTHRFAHLIGEKGAPADRCLAITFTRRAAEEMRERLDELLPGKAGPIEVTTFHALGLSLVREQRERLGLPDAFRVASEDERIALAQEVCTLARPKAERFLEELSRCKRSRDAEALRQLSGAAPFEAALRERGLVDFDDLLLMPVDLLERDPVLAEAYQRRFEWVSIDEYQDIDALQYRLIQLLVPPGGNLCAVGDPDQAIYRFRGADVGFFLRFEQDFPGGRRVSLTRNYRSSPTIVSAALEAIRPSSLVPGRALQAFSTQAAPATLGWHPAADERAEADFIAHAIEQLIGGASHYALDSGRADGARATAFSFGDFAVLYRTDAQAVALREGLARAGIPCQKRSHDRLRDRPEVRRLIEELAAQGAPIPGAGTTVWDWVRSTVRARQSRDPEAAAWESAAALEVLEPLAKRCGAGREAFLEALALGAEVDALDPRADRVALLTLHAAKGLEFPVVFLAGCEDGLLPLRWGGDSSGASADPAHEAEERRLFFVGLTRARTHLFLSSARNRVRRGQREETATSPFVSALDPRLLTRIERSAASAPRRPAARQLRLF